MKRVELVDSSILINVVDVPHEANHREEVIRRLDEKASAGIDLILPIAAVVETSQHVQRISNGDARRKCAITLRDRVMDTIAGQLPWTFSPVAWDETFVSGFFDQREPVPTFVDAMTTQGLEAGDLLIIAEWRLVRASLPRETHVVDVWTIDQALGATIAHLIAND